MSHSEKFLYPQPSFRASSHPERVMFDANLQEFAQRVSYIAGLESGGKMSAEESYQAIQSLWKALATTRNQLG